VRIAAAGALLLLLLTGVPVGAQTHPCDAAPQTTTPNLTSPVTVGFCHDGLDTAAGPVTFTSFTVTIGTTTHTQTLTPSALANSAGARYYQFTPVSVLTIGTQAVTVTAQSAAGSSLPSTPVSVCLVCTISVTIGITPP
jgi:hypothetical protein